MKKTSRSNPTLTAEFMHTWFRLGQAIKREIAPLLEREHGADFFDFLVLNTIEEGAIYPSHIAETFVVEPSKVSRTLEGMVKHGLVQRNIDPSDSRRIQLEITPEGKRLLRDVRQTVAKLIAPGFVTVGDARIRDVIQTIAQITQTMSTQAQAIEVG